MKKTRYIIALVAAVASSGGIAVGVFVGCIGVGATVSSIVYAENH